MNAPEKIWAQCSAHENWDDLNASIYPVSHWHQYTRTDLCLTQADLDAAVKAERARCADICDAIANEAKSYNIPHMAIGAQKCRDDIRKGEPT